MAYKYFNPNGPDGSVDDGANTLAILTDNDNAIRDACIAFGGFFFWPYQAIGGTAEQPAEGLYSNAAERVRLQFTWGTSGGADGNVTDTIYSYSSNSGGDYDIIGTETIVYDANGNVLSTSWV